METAFKTNAQPYAQEAGCKLYAVQKVGEIQWWMVSEKTGRHMVSSKPIKGQAVMTNRVKAHWQGFILNQSR
jgi:hypothetical protein